jgi:Fe-S cluster assembly ATP-binding protein
MALVNIEQTLLSRSLNEGFSVEKKRNENISDGYAGTQTGHSDETDSGLDIDAIRIV